MTGMNGNLPKNHNNSLVTNFIYSTHSFGYTANIPFYDASEGRLWEVIISIGSYFYFESPNFIPNSSYNYVEGTAVVPYQY